ncbi:MAG: hypothetical protein ACTSRS_08950 [Candidatus Helarchaeota archaeon]
MENIIIAILELILAAGIIIFWINFFKVEVHNPNKSEAYFSHEKSFPLADLGWLTPTLIISAIGLFLQERFGVFFTILAGSAAIFLGVLDLSYNIQQRATISQKEFIANLILNLVVLIAGIIFSIYGWLWF